MRFVVRFTTLALATALATGVHAETIRVAIGTQDTTINCATGGLLIRELKLLEKYVPHDGEYQGATYDIQWKNFASGAPLTNEMVADKLDIGSMADFPGSNNGAAFPKAGKQSYFITVLSGSTLGSGNGVVVPTQSTVTSLSELRGRKLIERVTGIDAAVNYLYHGLLGLQTRDLTWKPEYRKALGTSIETLKPMGRESPLQADAFVDDRYIRAAFRQAGLDYQARLADYAKTTMPLHRLPALPGERRHFGCVLRAERGGRDAGGSLRRATAFQRRPRARDLPMGLPSRTRREEKRLDRRLSREDRVRTTASRRPTAGRPALRRAGSSSAHDA